MLTSLVSSGFRPVAVTSSRGLSIPLRGISVVRLSLATSVGRLANSIGLVIVVRFHTIFHICILL